MTSPAKQPFPGLVASPAPAGSESVGPWAVACRDGGRVSHLRAAGAPNSRGSHGFIAPTFKAALLRMGSTAQGGHVAAPELHHNQDATPRGSSAGKQARGGR